MSKTIVKTKKNANQFKETGSKLKFCICGHHVKLHDMQFGCTQIVEASEAEDHWVCGCKDVVSIHIAAYQKMKKAKW